VKVLVLALLALGCGNRSVDPQETSNFRATIQLTNVGNTHSRVSRLNFNLSENEIDSHAELSIVDFWWSVTLTINGQLLAPVTGGVYPASIDVGRYLRVGNNTIEMRFRAPVGVSPIVTGGKFEPRFVGGKWVGSLNMSPSNGIESLEFPMHNGEITPRVTLRDGISSGVVRFFAALDGEIIQELGRVDIGEQRQVVGESVEWSGESWGFETGGNALYEFGAEFLGPDGTVIDRSMFRTGVRDLGIVEGALNLGGESVKLIGVRVESGWDSLALELEPIAPLGINAMELHGIALRDGWLNEADELGLPLIVLPRCDGNVNVRVEDVESNVQKLTAQDEALIGSVNDHPSVLMWTNEGSEQALRLINRTYQGDPHNRPIAGVDIPSWTIAMDRNQRNGSYFSSWIVEVTLGRGMEPSRAVSALGDAIEQGAIGGVLPLPKIIRHSDNWRIGWSEVLSELSEGLDRVEPDGFRGMSEVIVTGLTVGQVVYLEAPFTETVGVIVGGDGSALISTWYKGDATLRVGEMTQTVTIMPNIWRGFQLNRATTQAVWTGNSL
jgi:hypothetical protein